MDHLKERLREWRTEQHLTQEELAKRLDMHVGMVRKYEGGHAVPGGAVLGALARLGLNINWLLTGEGRAVQDSPPTPVEGNDEWWARIASQNERWAERWRDNSLAQGVHSFLMAMTHGDPYELPWLPRFTGPDQYQELVEETVALLDDVSHKDRAFASGLLVNLADFRSLLHLAFMRLVLKGWKASPKPGRGRR